MSRLTPQREGTRSPRATVHAAPSAAPFRSILFEQHESNTVADGRKEPECFADLNLDQIVASITAGREEYDLKPFFYTSLGHVETIHYRHDILRDLENQALLGHVRSFAERMRTMRQHLAQADKLHYQYQKERWFLEAVDVYYLIKPRPTAVRPWGLSRSGVPLFDNTIWDELGRADKRKLPVAAAARDNAGNWRQKRIKRFMQRVYDKPRPQRGLRSCVRPAPRGKPKPRPTGVVDYCNAIGGLTHDLALAELRSRGLLALREYLAGYTKSPAFTSLFAETKKLKDDLGAIRYCLHIKGKRITVSRYESEPDYGAEVVRAFEKFKQGEAKAYRFEFDATPDMNHVEAAILDRVARWHPDVFSSLDQYCHRHRAFLDGTIGRFDREVQFYVAYIEHVERLKAVGLPFCYPAVSDRSKEVSGREIFDLALADKLTREGAPLVTNDYYLKNPERILVVSSANQGGKTTFARTFGRLHWLASLGCLVPGREARLFLFDRLFTHFEREEDLRNLSGKLEDDLFRIHRILEQATPNSILVMNESFLSTTLNDALFLSKQVMERIVQRDMLCVSVTFLDELASLGESTVSMVSMVDPHTPTLRTFKIIRKPADGLAYAAAIAEKYRLTYENVKERIAR